MNSDAKINCLLNEIIESNKTIQIFGPAGSGKSSLAMSIVKTIISKDERLALWIDSDHKFSKNRFLQVNYYQQKFFPNDRLIKSLIISQPHNLNEQQRDIQSITENLLFFEKKLKISAVVLDSASYFFREFNGLTSWTKYSCRLLDFYEEQILPLRLFQKKTNCVLILIHQLTWHPKWGNRPVMNNIFEKIPSLWIELFKNIGKNSYSMNILTENKRKTMNYILESKGVLIL